LTQVIGTLWQVAHCEVGVSFMDAPRKEIEYADRSYGRARPSAGAG
jgi:hypothetical protein